MTRGSYMSDHVLLNLLNELSKRDKMRGLSSLINSIIQEHEWRYFTLRRDVIMIMHLLCTELYHVYCSHKWHIHFCGVPYYKRLHMCAYLMTYQQF